MLEMAQAAIKDVVIRMSRKNMLCIEREREMMLEMEKAGTSRREMLEENLLWREML